MYKKTLIAFMACATLSAFAMEHDGSINPVTYLRTEQSDIRLARAERNLQKYERLGFDGYRLNALHHYEAAATKERRPSGFCGAAELTEDRKEQRLLYLDALDLYEPITRMTLKSKGAPKDAADRVERIIDSCTGIITCNKYLKECAQRRKEYAMASIVRLRAQRDTTSAVTARKQRAIRALEKRVDILTQQEKELTVEQKKLRKQRKKLVIALDNS